MSLLIINIIGNRKDGGYGLGKDAGMKDVPFEYHCTLYIIALIPYYAIGINHPIKMGRPGL